MRLLEAESQALIKSYKQVTSNGREIEIKLAVSGPEEAEWLLDGAGFASATDRLFEANTVFDTPDLALINARKLLRIRECGGTVTLTFKGPPEDSRHKSREELEITASSAPALAAIFDRLGYEPKFRYEKFRTEYSDGSGEGSAQLDETPIGTFIELEGTPDWIDQAALRLGKTPEQYITDSYGTLYRRYREAHPGAGADMRFQQ
jgi:adenylate cyclase, class 2